MSGDASAPDWEGSLDGLSGQELELRIRELALVIANDAIHTRPSARIDQLNQRGALDKYRAACAERDRRVARLMGAVPPAADQPGARERA